MSAADQYRQRVTVMSPFGQHEVDILMDVPASGLLPDLLATAGLHPGQVRVGDDGWRLEDSGGSAVPPGQTLAQHGIAPGDVIQLCGLQHPGPGRGAASGIPPGGGAAATVPGLEPLDAGGPDQGAGGDPWLGRAWAGPPGPGERWPSPVVRPEPGSGRPAAAHGGGRRAS